MTANDEQRTLRDCVRDGESFTPIIDMWNDDHPDKLHKHYMKLVRQGRTPEMLKIENAIVKSGAGRRDISANIKREVILWVLQQSMSVMQARSHLIQKYKIAVSPAAIYYWLNHPPEIVEESSEVVVEDETDDEDPHSQLSGNLKHEPRRDDVSLALNNVGNGTEEKTANPQETADDVQIPEVGIQPDVQHTDNGSRNGVGV